MSGVNHVKAPPRQPRPASATQAMSSAARLDAPVDEALVDETKLARELWALDRKNAQLSRAVAQVRNGKIPTDVKLVTAAVSKNLEILHSLEAREGARLQAKMEAETLRRESRIVDAAEHRQKAMDKVTLKNVAETARRETSSAKRGEQEHAAVVRIETKRDAEKARRDHEAHTLVTREHLLQEQRLVAGHEREAQRREAMRERQERDFGEVVCKDSTRREHAGQRLETERLQKEARDPQVLRSRSHAALMKGVTTVAPYCSQLRPRGVVLSRWTHGDA